LKIVQIIFQKIFLCNSLDFLTLGPLKIENEKCLVLNSSEGAPNDKKLFVRPVWSLALVLSTIWRKVMV
jgi:hypothetical protein